MQCKQVVRCATELIALLLRALLCIARILGALAALKAISRTMLMESTIYIHSPPRLSGYQLFVFKADSCDRFKIDLRIFSKDLTSTQDIGKHFSLYSVTLN